LVEKRVEELRPWGVNVPFIVLGLAYFLAGGLSLWKNPQDHGYLMMVGAYALYEGMITRLFFPATKYFKLQALALISLAVPLPEAQALSSYALTFLELRALRDVKSYGSRFPVNALVLASPVLSSISWTAFVFLKNPTLLFPPLVSYVLGINIGIFRATLGSKPLFGWRQAPYLALASLSFLPVAFSAAVILYSALVLLTATNLRSTSTVVLVSFLVSGLETLFLNDFVHAFSLGFMLASFINCIVYSTSRYAFNGVPHFLSVLLILVSSLAWPLFKVVSFVLTGAALLLFVYAMRHNLTLNALKYGMSEVYLREQTRSVQS